MKFSEIVCTDFYSVNCLSTLHKQGNSVILAGICVIAILQKKSPAPATERREIPC